MCGLRTVFTYLRMIHALITSSASTERILSSCMTSVVNKPDRVILHCSDTEDYLYGSEGFDRITVNHIDMWHRERGWLGCGYHFVVRRSGIIEVGRDLKDIGAHTLGHNINTIGVCWIGRKYPTTVQIRELLNLYTMIKRMRGIQWFDWYGHYEFNKFKLCPGFSMEIFRSLLCWYDHTVHHTDNRT